MGEKQEEGFIRTSSNMDRVLFFCGILFFLSCSNEIQEDPIPFTIFDNIEINLASIEYFDLTTKGYMLISGGVKGIILYKNPFKEEYIAYERNCSYLPLDDKAIVEIDESSLFMVDHSCKSEFNFEDGWPRGGAATFPLRKYRTIVNGNLLIITDEPLQ